ncbi:outer membrane protein [Mesorhizobium sp. M0491]|uniref:outer membrane protein n=1 Tax=Mesorhizobium sp. M0491 TaxID=2956950 RepID=UPI0033363493
MKIHLLAAALVFGVVFPAIAADDDAKTLFVESAHNWSGVYVGAQGGYYQGVNSNVDVTICEEVGCELGVLLANSALTDLNWVADSDPSGFIGGGQIGYNFQSGTLVVGAELDFQIGSGGGTDITCISVLGCEIPVTANASSELEWLGTARGRIGAAFDRTLIYATGGMAFGKVRNYFDVNLGVDPYVFSNEERSTRFGWTVGGGAEYALTDELSLKGEYLYYNLADSTMTTLSYGVGNPQGRIGTYKFSNDGQLVRVGLNYRF